MTSAPSTPLGVSPESPWLGLRSFTEDVRDYFYGRDAEIQELFERVQHRTLTILYGQSGLGKTSLLQAGLIPRLKEAGFTPIVIRLVHDATDWRLEEQVVFLLEMAIPAVSLHKPEGDVILYGKRSSRWEQFGHPIDPIKIPSAILAQFSESRDVIRRLPSLWQLFHDPEFGLVNSGVSPVLIFDQFEELFSQGEAKRPEEAREFLESLACLVENRPPGFVRAAMEQDDALADRLVLGPQPCKVLLTLRDDFLHRLERGRRQMPSMMDNRMELRLLSGPQAYRAVYEPACKRPGGAVWATLTSGEGGGPILFPETARRLVRFVAGAPADTPLEEIDNVPPLLSLICEQLNTRRLAQNEATIQADSLAKSAPEVLRDFYESSFAAHPPAIRHFVEDQLVSASGFRESKTLDTAVAQLTAASVPNADAVLRSLVDQRLLVIEDRGGIARVELTHDILAPIAAAARKERAERLSKLESQRTLAVERQQRRLFMAIAGVMTVMLIAAISSGLLAWHAQAASSTAQTLMQKREGEAREADLKARESRQLTELAQHNEAAQRSLAEFYKGLVYRSNKATWVDSSSSARQMIGDGSCVRCHSNESPYDSVVPQDFILLDECRKFNDSAEPDRHSQAYHTLHSSSGRDICRNLGIKDTVQAFECLNCHANWRHKEGYSAPQFMELGVNCESCHGAAEDWEQLHTTIPWRSKTPDEKLSFGMKEMRDPLIRARLCISCHVGDSTEGKIVTHGMYAAGHPRLTGVEVLLTADLRPSHWRNLREKGNFAFRRQYLGANVPSSESDSNDELPRFKNAVLGGVMVLRQSVKLIAGESAGTLSLDPGILQCAHCHPGSVADQSAPTKKATFPVILPRALLPLALAQSTKEANGITAISLELSPTLQRFESAVATRDSRAIDLAKLKPSSPESQERLNLSTEVQELSRNVVALSTEILLLLDELTLRLQSVRFDKQAAERTLKVLTTIGRDEPGDFQTAQQLVWIYKVIYTELNAPYPTFASRNEIEKSGDKNSNQKSRLEMANRVRDDVERLKAWRKDKWEASLARTHEIIAQFGWNEALLLERSAETAQKARDDFSQYLEATKGFEWDEFRHMFQSLPTK